MVERARLESWYRGNSIEGSNPFLSAKTNENQRFTLVFLCLNANEACFSERIRHKKAQDAEGELVYRCFGTVPLRVLLSEAKKNPLLKTRISWSSEP